MPLVAWRAERVLRDTTARNAVLLAVVHALQLLAGYIQTASFVRPTSRPGRYGHRRAGA